MPELKNRKWERFCQEFVFDLNATQAVLRSGIFTDNPASAQVLGSNLLSKDIVAARVKELQQETADRLGLNAEYVLKQINEVGLRCMQKVPVLDWDYKEKRYVQKTDDDGNHIWQFDSNGANRAWELLGKHIDLFNKDNKSKQTVIKVGIINNK